jgi:hypothetical protein
MFAPSFPDRYKDPTLCWHRVHPLDLTRAECKPWKVNIALTQDQVPEGERYCSWCAKIDAFDAHRLASRGQKS